MMNLVVCVYHGQLVLVWLLLTLVIVPLWCMDTVTTASSSPNPLSCDESIRQDVSRLLEDPKALSLPYGRAFLAREFDKALYLDYISHPNGKLTSTKDTQMLEIPSMATEITVHVSTCDLLIETATSSSVVSSMDICKVSLYARLVGASVIATEAIGSKTNASHCEWKLVFNGKNFGRLKSGTYDLETIIMWINESDEPSSHIRARDKESRMNDGSVIHLGGLGTHPFHAVNATHKYHNFTGYLLQGHSKSVYLITSRDEKRAFANYNALLSLGYGEIEILRVPETFLSLFISGKDLVEADKYSFGESVMKTRSIHHASATKDLISKINEHTVLTVDSPSRAQAAVFSNIPTIEIKGSNNGDSHQFKCSGGDAMHGRWIKDLNCSRFATSSQSEPISESVPIGHVCRHSLPVYAKSMPWIYSNRAKSMIWRPYDCNLRAFPLDSPYFSDDGIKNTTIFPSTLQHAMRLAGIGLLAGFGDSLGDEQRDEILGLLKGDYEWAPGFGISCQNNKNRLHRLQEHSMLIKCIEDTVMNLEPSIPLYPSTKSPLFSHPIVSTDQDLKNMKLPVRQVVLFTNFMSQHSVWTMTLSEIEEALRKQASNHQLLAEKFASQKNIQYRRIFFAATMTHGFRTGGLTPGRQRWLNQKATEILGASGWEIFDSYGMTLSRPDGSNDGIHYRGGVSSAMTDVVMNMIISPKTNKDFKHLYEEAKQELSRLRQKKILWNAGGISR